MILPALVSLYDRLAADPESEIAEPGFSRQQVSFVVVVSIDGTLVDIVDNRRNVTDAKGKSKVSQASLLVFGQAKPSGQGINPCFLWDNAAYMLGWKAEDPKPERTRESFAAFRDAHIARMDAIGDKGYAAVCRFLRDWDPSRFNPTDKQAEMLGSFGVFRVDGEHRYVHQRPAIEAWYRRSLTEADGDAALASAASNRVPSLVSGAPARVARLHEPKIKGVWGAQSSGATLVSFNQDAFESYGKSQGENAPVAEEEAFKYCTALNTLLADPRRRAQIGDATVVWWTDGPVDDLTDDLIASLFTVNPAVESRANVDRLADAMARLAQGTTPDFQGTEQGLHVLGLSPNAARLSVRLWWNGTVGELIERVSQHQVDLRLEPVPERDSGRAFSIYRIIRETARVFDARPDMETVSPTLAGEIARAVLSGGPYPLSLLQTVIRRVRSDGEIGHGRAAVVKACITRRRRLVAADGHFEEVPVALDVNGPEPYQLGRLFAVLEKTQGDALGQVNASICDRYFGAASATPASVMPRLVRLTQHHISKLEGGRRVNREKLLQEVIGKIHRYPAHLNLEQQGLFQIGYYHQRAELFTKKSDDNTATEETES